MLLVGGSVVDVVIVVVVMFIVVELVLCGFGSDVFVILWDGKELYGLNVFGIVL